MIIKRVVIIKRAVKNHPRIILKNIIIIIKIIKIII